MSTSIDLPFTPADVLARAEKEMRDGVADKVWPAIMADPELKRARSKLSIHEFRLIVAHCLNQMQPAAGETIRTTQHGSMEDASVTVQSAVDASSPKLLEAMRLYRLSAEAAGGCGDGNCVVLKPVGMHTNGGCRCSDNRMKAQRMMHAGQRLYEALS